MIKGAQINNYRGLKELKIDDLSKFNIFIGKNGCGKTSILEALTLAANGKNPKQFFDTINGRRHYIGQPEEVLDSLFRDLEPKKSSDRDRPLIIIDYEDDKKRTGRSGSYGFSFYTVEKDKSYKFKTGESVGSIYESYYYHPTSSNKKGASHKTKIFTTGEEIRFGEISECDICLNAVFLPFGINSTIESLNLLSEINDSRKNRAEFVKNLEFIYPSVEEVSPNNGSIKALLAGKDKTMPISLLGSGFLKVFELLLHIPRKVDVLCVDEIDSGLHHTVMQDFWLKLREGLKDQPTQFFCTTHSEELIKNTLESFKNAPDDIAVFRLETNRKGKLQATRIDYEALKFAKEEISSAPEYVS